MEEKIMEETYKDWKIKVDEKTDEFMATDKTNEFTLRSNSLKEIKKKIDKFGFTRIPIYWKDYNVVHAGEITSVVETGSKWHPLEFWINYGENKQRTKVNIQALCKQSEENKKIFDEILQLEKQKDEIRIKVEGLSAQLQRLKYANIGRPELDKVQV